MTDQETAYTEIDRLVKKFKAMSGAQRKGMNEDATRLGFILPMFRALGWDIENHNEVSPEEKVSRGWVDFSFRIGNVPRYFLETKRASEDLNDPRWVKQAIDYSWTKSVTWALLSDFEGLRVFNAEWKEENPFRAQFIEFNVDTYLGDFNRLWWLSRAETAQRRLDAEAEKVGKKDKRQPVSQILFDDLKTWRGKLSKDLTGFNSISTAEADNAVLRMLNRLIFIRTAEDRDVESPRLLALIREMKDKGQIKDLSKGLAALFREMDGVYNSELFAPHSSEGFYVTPSVIEEVITGLYERNFIRYNFNAMDADVLGTVYEQYLGAVVTDQPQETKTAKRDRLNPEEGLTVEARRKKRKSQGIYYTPSFVTKYIVQQTVGRYLDEHGYHPHPPRVLDMACGSGSFLIEAFDVIDKYVMNSRNQSSVSSNQLSVFDRARQLEVLQNCIFGVDKDQQAVDVARLNLLLRALHSREKLPMLENIQHGDSLRPETFTPSAFGTSPKSDEPQSDLGEAGWGFDVIIGNPPYVRAENMPREERDYYMSGAFETAYGRFDIFILFLERAIKLLKEGGRLGFIIPYAGFTQNYALMLRKFILDNCVIETIVDLTNYKVFADASVATCILVLRKETSPEKRAQHEVSIIRQDTYDEGIVEIGKHLPQKVFVDTPNNTFRLNLDSSILQLVEKIDAQSVRFGDVCYLITGAVLHNSETGESKERLISTKNKKGLKPYIEAKEIGRYLPPVSTKFLDYKPNEVHRPKFRELFENEKIMIARIATEVKATLDYNHLYTDHTIDLAVRKDMLVNVKHRDIKISEEEAKLSQRYDLHYLLGILNSKLATWYLQNMLGMAIEINPETGRQLPIRRIDFGNAAEKSAHDGIVKSVEKMLSLQKERQSVRREDDLDHVRSLERKIASVDEEIDRKVYELYGLTVDEVRIVEGS